MKEGAGGRYEGSRSLAVRVCPAGIGEAKDSMEGLEENTVHFETDRDHPDLDVCVLIPCYNNLLGLQKSLQSIHYHPGRLGVVVVDDGSDPQVSEPDVRDFLEMSFLLKVILLPENAGITAALNVGLQWIRQNWPARYIGRLDCGDTCHPDRFLKQVAFLDGHPRVGLLGSWCTFLDPATGKGYAYTTPLHHEGILAEMASRNIFIHPTVLFRAELVESLGGYPTNYPFVEDYALFYLMLHRMEGAVLDQFLVTCELTSRGISGVNRKKQLLGRLKVIAAFEGSPSLKYQGMIKLLLLWGMPSKFILWLKTASTSWK